MSAPVEEDLVEWLKDAGRRRTGPRPSPAPKAPEAVPAAIPPGRTRPRPLFLTALAALAFLQYYYTDVFLQISLLPTLIVFVPVP